jgi:type VI secretion system protein ImpL
VGRTGTGVVHGLKFVLQSKARLAIGIVVVLGVVILGYALGWWAWLGGVAGGWFWSVLVLLLAGGILLWAQWYLPRYREKRFLERMRAAEGQTTTASGESDRQLHDKLQEAIRILKNSPEIRKTGGLALYALPWYLLLGSSQAGKTTLLRSVAHDFSPFAHASSTVDGPTQSCDWWFFNTAIILDTAGGYAFPTAQEHQSAQWYRLLQLLRHYRELQPINGMIIAIAADALATKSTDELRADAAELRKRLDEAIRELGVEFPVYLLLTRCDLLEGFTEFCGRLPEATLQQVFGYVKDSTRPSEHRQGVGFEAMFETILDRLYQLRLTLLRDKLPSAALRQKLFCFPEEFRALQKPLGTFVETLFAENPYQHTPFFRGLFFCSAQQQGQTVSFLRRDLHFDGQQRPLEREVKGYFLHDLFSVILPRDRYLVRRTAKATAMRRLKDLVGLALCLTLCVLAVVLLTQAARSDGEIYAAADEAHCRAALDGADFGALLEQTERCRQVVQRLSEENHRRPAWSRLLYDRSGRLAGQWRQRYVEKFSTEILQPLDASLAQQILASAEPIPFVFLLINRIELITQCLSGEGCPPSFEGDARPDYKLMLNASPQHPSQGSRGEQLQAAYEAYLRWATAARAPLEREMDGLAAELRRWFSRRQFAPQQIVSWANQHYAPISAQAIWQGPLTAGDRQAGRVDGAYTPNAWKQSLLPFLQRAGDALPDMKPVLQEFRGGYQRQYFEAWRRFLEEFPQGELPWWRSREQRRLLALRVLDENSPYQQVIDVALEHLKPLLPAMPGAGLPPTQTAEEGLRHRLARVFTHIKQTVMDVWPGRPGREVETSVSAGLAADVPVWVAVLQRYATSDSRKVYLTLLKEIRQQIGDDVPKEQFFQLAYAGFKEGRPSEKSAQPVLKALWTINRFQEKEGVQDAALEKSVWPVIERPALIAWKVILEQAGEFLQRAWTENISIPAKGLSKVEQATFLHGPQGKVREFTAQFVSPFLVDHDTRPGRVLGEELPIPAHILEALRETKQLGPILELKTPHRVRVEATRDSIIDSPAGVVEDKTEFAVECAVNTFKVSTRAHDLTPASTTVFWSSDGCGDVTISVYVSCDRSCVERAAAAGMNAPEAASMRLVKRYPGQTGFLQFLQDFRSGSQALVGSDFQAGEDVVRRYRIRSVHVFYRVEIPETLAKLIASILK